MDEPITQSREQTSWECIQSGEAPVDEYELGELAEGIDFLTDFFSEKYLKEYIASGGSKMKFITGRRGSGKTHLLRLIGLHARKNSYITVSFSANEIWMHDFSNIFFEVLRQCDLMKILEKAAQKVIANLGYDPADIPDGSTFIDYLAGRGEADPLNKLELRRSLKRMFHDNPLLDNNFAQTCALLTGSILGHPTLEPQNQELLFGWLHGQKGIRLVQLRALGLSPTRITKFNARNMLRSLAEVIHIAGYAGLAISIDDMEILLNRSSLLPIHYTKMRRNDTYESIRELIDDIDTMHHVLFLFSFDRSLMDDENFGLKSYQALWARIQNEVVSDRFNRFADIIDLDRLGRQIYDADALTRMSSKLSVIAAEHGRELAVLSAEQAEQLIRQDRVVNFGLPLAVNRCAFEPVEDAFMTETY